MQEYACRVTNDGRQTHCKSTRTVNRHVIHRHTVNLKLYLILFNFLPFFFFLIFYRESETVDPRSGHPVPQGDSSKSFARFWG